MGYTHYFTRTEVPPPSGAYGTLCTDARILFSFAAGEGIDLAGIHGEGSPEIGPEYIAFNGRKPADYESFVWEAGASGFRFCKTAYRPYDAAVCAFLIRAKVVYGDAIDIESDGSWEDWKPGRELYSAAFGTDAPNPGLSQ